eukprot:TRINITY_DN1775_c1_g1_i1.p1 TRINITY_DN1775_c1_g1~~TRINITY_DN1775_c1_g1_i1.p1  ORF type:complete len:100 (-),score=10.33 TRINITY_DN1775_c1_g1_i1:984-1283(-)
MHVAVFGPTVWWVKLTDTIHQRRAPAGLPMSPLQDCGVRFHQMMGYVGHTTVLLPDFQDDPDSGNLKVFQFPLKFLDIICLESVFRTSKYAWNHLGKVC